MSDVGRLARVGRCKVDTSSSRKYLDSTDDDDVFKVWSCKSNSMTLDADESLGCGDDDVCVAQSSYSTRKMSPLLHSEADLAYKSRLVLTSRCVVVVDAVLLLLLLNVRAGRCARSRWTRFEWFVVPVVAVVLVESGAGSQEKKFVRRGSKIMTYMQRSRD